MKDKRREMKPMNEAEIEQSFIEDVEAVKDELPVNVEYKVEVTIPKLRVREQPNSEAESIDAISKGQSVTIVEEQNGWGRTKFGNGWVNLKFTRRVE